MKKDLGDYFMVHTVLYVRVRTYSNTYNAEKDKRRNIFFNVYFTTMICAGMAPIGMHIVLRCV